jgi:predicted RNA binding protein YcfA (HicA-like mRNA interferase family)
MSPALPVVKAKACLRALERAGFYIHHSTGSHARLFHRVKRELRVTIPLHNRDLPLLVLKSILRQSELSIEEFIALL